MNEMYTIWETRPRTASPQRNLIDVAYHEEIWVHPVFSNTRWLCVWDRWGNGSGLVRGYLKADTNALAGSWVDKTVERVAALAGLRARPSSLTDLAQTP